MCGITGIIDYSNNLNNKENILKMNKSIIHRGPDQQGTYIDKNVALGHVRLSIIDLSEKGKQPMSDNTGQIQIVFNGEIYNFQEIKKNLSEFEFKSRTDTEVIIYGYKKWGLENTLSKFNGMFSFCLWDNVKKEAYLVRDRFGKKPLYYTIYKGSVIFASEIKAILALDFIKRGVDRESLYYYLSFLSTPAPKTLFEGIYKVPAGHYLKINKSKVELVKYFDINKDFNIDYSLKPNQVLLDKVEKQLKESVSLRQMSDVPQGVYLSGGVDSSLLVALNSKIKKDPINTFSITFNDKGLDEEKYSDIVAKQYQTNHHKELLDEDKMYSALDKIIYYEDEPIADPVNLPLYYLAKMTRNNGVIVTHVGEGADELFCGYKYYQILYNNYNYFKLLSKTKAIVNPLLPLLPKSRNRERFAVNYFINSQISSRNVMAFYDSEKYFLNYDTKNYSSEKKLAEYAKYKSTKVEEFFFDLRSTELQLRLPELLFMRLDKFTMANSLESRAPFMDYNLVKLAYSIPVTTHMYNNQPKYLLKKISEKYLPKDLIYRKKIGFGAPIEDFFNYYEDNLEKTLKQNFMKKEFDINKFETLLQHKSNKQNHFKLWALLNYSLWYERWINDK